MGVPTITGTATGGRMGPGTTTVTPPAGAQSYYAVVGCVLETTGSVTPPPGWTLHQSGRNPADPVTSAWYTYTGAAGAGSSWSLSANSGIESMAITIIGLDEPTQPVAFGYTHHSQTNGSAFTGSSPAATPAEGGLVLRGLTGNPFRSATTGATVTPPAGAPLGRATATTLIPTWDTIVASIACAEQPGAGSTGTAQWTLSPLPDATGGGVAAPVTITVVLATDDTSGVVGQLAASTPVPTATLAGTQTVRGQLTAPVPTPTASLTGRQVLRGTLDARTPPPSAAITGVQTVRGTLHAYAPVPTAGLTGTQLLRGALAADGIPARATITGRQTVRGQLDATTPLPTALMVGHQGEAVPTMRGQLVAVVPPPVAEIVGRMTNRGQLDAHAPGVTAALSGRRIVHGQLVASAPLPVAHLVGRAGEPPPAPTPDARTLRIDREDRTLRIDHEDRTLRIGDHP